MLNGVGLNIAAYAKALVQSRAAQRRDLRYRMVISLALLRAYPGKARESDQNDRHSDAELCFGFHELPPCFELRAGKPESNSIIIQQHEFRDVELPPKLSAAGSPLLYLPSLERVGLTPREWSGAGQCRLI